MSTYFPPQSAISELYSIARSQLPHVRFRRTSYPIAYMHVLLFQIFYDTLPNTGTVFATFPKKLVPRHFWCDKCTMYIYRCSLPMRTLPTGARRLPVDAAVGRCRRPSGLHIASSRGKHSDLMTRCVTIIVIYIGDVF